MLVTQEILGILDLKRRCPQLTLMTLKGYLNLYGTEVEDYFDFGEIAVFEEEDMNTTVLCLVDLEPEEKKRRRKKSPRKHAGLERRVKYRHRYTYTNPLNRICGYLILEESKKDESTIIVSAVCSSPFAPITRGIGTDLMRAGIALGTLLGYRDIVLEVSNEHSQAPDEESESESEDEEDWIDMTEEEEIMDELIHMVAHEFWRKCLRRTPHPYYNLDKTYLIELLTGYLVGYEEEEEDEDSVSEDETETPEEKEEPGDCDYGGYWYQRGKKSQQKLIGFYEHCGFREDPTAREHFGDIPLPCYRYEL
jgi:ribosomal protein S18 acetylase RimI-like enzyme